MASQNGIVGDDTGTDLPIGIQEEDLMPEKNAAKFSKSKEYEVFKNHMESRIAYYQGYLPGGIELAHAQESERGKMWLVADTVIGEFRAVLQAYQQAQEAVAEDAQRKRA